MMKSETFLLIVCSMFASVQLEYLVDEVTPFDPACVDDISLNASPVNFSRENNVGCICGIFLTSQFTKLSHEQPKGNSAFQFGYPEKLPCTSVGNKMCMNKCIDTIAKQLANSALLICGSIERDCFKEKAYLFFKNCKDEWINTNLSTGQEFCCRNYTPYKCPTSNRFTL